MSAAASDPLFANGGAVGRAMAAHAWTATSVGPPATWPAELRSVIRILLTSQFSMWMGWGPDLTVFYNDAYQRDTLRTKHPWALGRPAREVWAEIWPDIGPRIQSVIDTGQATWDESLLLFLERSGYREESYHTFSYSPLADDSGRVQGFLCVVSEDTQRVLSERRLRILSELGDISAITAPTVDDACTATMAVLGRGRTDVPFASIYLLDPDGDTARRAAFSGLVDDERILPKQLSRHRPPGLPAWEAIDTGRPVRAPGLSGVHAGLFLPSPLERLAGSDRPADPAATLVLPLAGGGAGGSVGVLFAGISPFRALDAEYELFLDLVAGQVNTAIADATAFQDQRRRAEDLAELDRAKTEFFTGVSHELRTPLTLISGPAEDGLADRDEPLPPAQRARMEIIHRNSGRLRRLVDTMLDFARLERGRLAADLVPVDLAALTRGIAESFAPAIGRAGLDLRIDCPDLPSAVSVDVDMWEKIVLNLLSNALKYTMAGHVGLSLARSATGLRLDVGDSGIGIPAADLPLLFQRFHRVRGAAGRSHEGSGIGLALVAELTALHGGEVAVDSRLGEGSTFTVTLPGSLLTSARPAPAGATVSTERHRDEALQWIDTDEDLGAAGPQDAGHAAGATVLVVEDNPDLRRFLARLLEPHYAVVLAQDGHEALDRIAVHAPDLVLTDVMMPGMDGFALLARMRADPATATIPVVMLSARAGEEAAIEGLGAGADDYLAKPFSSHDLLARVRSNITLSRMRNNEATWRRALIEALRDGFFVIDEDDAIIEVNDAFEAILGYGRDGVPYRAPYPWVPRPEDDPGTASVISDVLATGRSSTIVTPLVHRGGRRVWVEAIFNTAKDPATGRSVRVGTLRDITEAKRAEQANELMAEIGRQQTAPGRLDERLREVLRAAAPLLGDAAVVAVRAPDGTFVPSAAGVPGDPARERALLATAPWGDPAEAPAPFATTSALTAEVRSDHGVLASLAFLSTNRARVYDGADEVLAGEIGTRIARMIEIQRATTRARQTHLLTAALATAPDLDAAAAALAGAGVDLLGASSVAVLHQRSGRTLHVVHQVGEQPSQRAALADFPPVADCARTGAAVWVRDGSEWATAYPALEDDRGIAGRPGYAALPLAVGHEVVGVLAIAYATRRDFSDHERTVALNLASDAARAIERLALSDVRRELAETLQRSLLPAALPELARLDLAAHYMPAAWGSKAGGDWYDVLELDDDRVAVVVGDVVGQGPAAAAVMGQLRSALATHLLDELSPAAALQRLDRFARRVDGARGSSVICLVLDTRNGVMTWARAGHPPPIVLDVDGARCLEDAYGCVLGVQGAPPFVEAEAMLQPGAAVLLYTDGLIERRNEVIDDGLGRLADAAAAHAADLPEALIAGVLRRTIADEGPADDIAVIVARLRPAPLEWQVPADQHQLVGIRRTVAAWASEAALPPDQLDDLQFALGEAATNAIEHAYLDGTPRPVAFRLSMAAGGRVEVTVADEGAWRVPAADPGYRGRGLAMIDALSEDLVVDAAEAGTTVRFTVPRPPPGDTTAAPVRSIRAAVPAESGAELHVERTSGPDLYLRLAGELDLTSVMPIRTPLMELLRDGTGPAVLDLREVTYLGSAGVALVIDAVEAAAGGLRLLTAGGGPVDRILALAGVPLPRAAPAGG